ncbi:helix-turn-helix domain-containing protein [Cerasicoccus fimbriatus]|uniref:helix-turn-helix domain-containing protein n=1 Tax=Cerasicoccus fimbriatus TaxID=3014554 RepID=UPI0022B4DC5D|nr:helix-turn-helix domain-containing protein [Cerasicoccus sp. TK19100]
MAKHSYQVALGFDPQGKSYLTQVASGIFQESRVQPDLDYVVMYPWFHLPRGLTREQMLAQTDGSITGVRQESIDLIRQNKMPTITVGPEALVLEDFPWIGPDYVGIARLACEFFAARGYRRIEYFHCGDYFTPHSLVLRDASMEAASSLRMECHVFQLDVWQPGGKGVRLDEQLTALAEYLKSVPLPCAVFAPDDHHSWRVCQACKIAGLEIPRDVSILGVRSDDYICEFSKPALSHIHIDYQEIGRLAARQIAEFVRGKAPPLRMLTRGFQIHERASSSMTAHRNPVVEAAVHYMQANLHESVSVDMIAASARVSRRTLIRRFNEILDKPPTEVLRELRLDHAKKLLSNSDLPFSEVALRCGLSDQPQLNRMIREATGKTPAQFRREYSF